MRPGIPQKPSQIDTIYIWQTHFPYSTIKHWTLIKNASSLCSLLTPPTPPHSHLTPKTLRISANPKTNCGRGGVPTPLLSLPAGEYIAGHIVVSICVSQIIDLLVRLLQCPLHGATDQAHLTRVFRGAYDVLYTYMIGNSRKNALYFAKYIDFFQTQITVKAVRTSSHRHP